MKRFLCLTALAAVSTTALAADVGVSVRIGEPGFYGRLDIGDYPPPRVVYQEPIVIQPAPAQVAREPIYLHVPPGQSKNWRRHCHKYNACGQPVYFVQNSWYEKEYAPRYHERHGEGRGESDHNDDRGGRHDRGHGRGNDHGNN